MEETQPCIRDRGIKPRETVVCGKIYPFAALKEANEEAKAHERLYESTAWVHPSELDNKDSRTEG